MQPQVSNVAVLSDRDPVVLVQKYAYPGRTFQVFRKPTSAGERFSLSPGVEMEPFLNWHIAPTLFQTAEDLAGIAPEIFALVYRDEAHPPTYDVDPVPRSGGEIMAVVYDAEADCYRCAACVDGYDAVESISAPTLDEAIGRGLAKLYDIMAGRA